MPVENVHQFYWALASPLTASPFPKLAIGILLFLAAMAALGLLYEAANGMVIAVFIVSYTVLLLVLPNFSAGARYLVPHLLVLGAFAVRGAAVVGRLVNSGIGASIFSPSGPPFACRLSVPLRKCSNGCTFTV